MDESKKNNDDPSSTYPKNNGSSGGNTDQKPDFNTQPNNVPNYESNVDTNQTNSNSNEFAQKPPMVSTKFIAKVFGISIAFVLIIVGAVFAYKIYKDMTKPIPVDPCTLLECPTAECPTTKLPADDPKCKPPIPVPVTENPMFAYIKDHSSIWIVNSNGDPSTKSKVFETFSKDENITTLNWHEKNKITYSKCAKNTCEIATYDVGDKSITPNIVDTDSLFIRKINWSDEKSYIAYISTKTAAVSNDKIIPKNTQMAVLKLKSGSYNRELNSFYTKDDPSNSQSRIFFTPDNEYIVFSTIKTTFEEDPEKEGSVIETTSPITLVYRLNGTLVEEIENSSDPFLLDTNVIGYKKDNALRYKSIGSEAETVITSFTDSYNPEISPDKKEVAYWKNEGGFSDVVLGIFDSKSSIHRNVLRGIVLPKWLDQNNVAGIKADGCLGQNCLLFEYLTTSLAIVNIREAGKVTLVDQGKSIGEIELQTGVQPTNPNDALENQSEQSEDSQNTQQN